ncbi:hypothetical protein IAR55_002155 [Kwoniella newhampshirensis]|uniref:Spindle pole body component n=1 Tax=Kwoniella newhampshirensis TaxID=1651941 RepID=A0AAW0Z1J4_9TREE
MSPQIKLNRLAQQLVVSLRPELSDVDNRTVRDQLSNTVLRHIRADKDGGARKEWDEVKASLEGLSRAAAIRVQTDLAEALEENVSVLEQCKTLGSRGWEEDVEIRMGNLPQHIHLLLNLAEKPLAQTHDFAHSYLHRRPPTGPTADQILYQQIMQSEPYDPGETYDEEVLSGWTDSDSDQDSMDDSSSSSGRSPMEDEVRTPDSVALRAQRRRMGEQRRKDELEERSRRAEEVVRGLKKGYWERLGQVGEMKEDLYGWKELSMVPASTIAKKLLSERASNDLAINATQLQRELLFALSGRPGVVFTITCDGQCTIKPDHPEVHHLTPTAVRGLLETFSIRATQAARIRAFVSNTLQPIKSSSSPPKSSRKPSNRVNKTQQAFAEACRGVVNVFDTWLSELEASFVFGSNELSSSSSVSGISAATTPLLLNLEVEKNHAPLLEHLSSFIPHSHSPTLLLNLIYSTMISIGQTKNPRHLAALRQIFLLSARPSWLILGKWLNEGMPVPLSLTDPEEGTFSSLSLEDDEAVLDEEFFIKRDRDVSWADEDFFESGFVVGDEGWPLWLGEEAGELVLEAGKARGLLRSLMGNVAGLERWSPLEEVLAPLQSPREDAVHLASPNETVDIKERLSTYLRPMCQLTQFHLRRVLDEECGLEQHLDAIEGLMFLKGFEVIHEWTNMLFDKAQLRGRWMDFQFLTSTLRDITETKQALWMNPSAIRIRTVRLQGPITGPRALGIIRADYQTPFPLSQLFTSTSIELRAEVFAFMLQVSMGRHIATGTIYSDSEALSRCSTHDDASEIRALWPVRQKIVWFLDTLYIWLTERVIETETKRYRNKLEEMTSLRSMIVLELEHTRSIRDYCFLNTASSDLHEAILSILDMTNIISECITSFVGAQTLTTTGAQKPKITSSNITERRKPRRKRSNIDFSSDEEDHNERDDGGKRHIEEISVSFVDQSLGARMKKLNDELDGCVKTIKDGVEKLAMDHAGDGSDAWGMLSWDLEEWK